MAGGLTYPSAVGLGGAGAGAKALRPGSVTGQLLLQHHASAKVKAGLFWQWIVCDFVANTVITAYFSQNGQCPFLSNT